MGSTMSAGQIVYVSPSRFTVGELTKPPYRSENPSVALTVDHLYGCSWGDFKCIFSCLEGWSHTVGPCFFPTKPSITQRTVLWFQACVDHGLMISGKRLRRKSGLSLAPKYVSPFDGERTIPGLRFWEGTCPRKNEATRPKTTIGTSMWSVGISHRIKLSYRVGELWLISLAKRSTLPRRSHSEAFDWKAVRHEISLRRPVSTHIPLRHIRLEGSEGINRQLRLVALLKKRSIGRTCTRQIGCIAYIPPRNIRLEGGCVAHIALRSVRIKSAALAKHAVQFGWNTHVPLRNIRVESAELLKYDNQVGFVGHNCSLTIQDQRCSG